MSVFTRRVVFESPVGPLLAEARAGALQRLSFLDEAQRAALAPETHTGDDDETHLLERLRVELEEYFAGRRRGFDIPLRAEGTEFQKRIWAGLLEVPYAHTWSYRELGTRTGDAAAVRAIGQANGANPIAIIVPCHRIVNDDGSLGGYGGGAWRKQFLIDLERGDRLF